MTIEERLENMERELGCQKRCNRRLLGAILLLIGGLVTAGVFKTTVTPAQAQGAGTVKEIRARSIFTRGIFIEDEKGKGRAILIASEDGPNLTLWDENGKPRATLFVGKDGPFLRLSNENGKPSATLIASKYGPNLTLWDKKGEARVRLDVSEDGTNLTLCDENGRPRVRLDVGNDGPSLSLNDENGNSRFAAGKTWIESQDGKTIEYPESSLILYGPDGKVIWSAIK